MFKEEPIFEEQINLEDLVFSTQEINDVVETIKHESKEVVFKVSDKKTENVQTPNIVQNNENKPNEVISNFNENSKNCQTFQKEHLKEVKLENLNQENALDQTINEPTEVITPVNPKSMSFANKFEQFALKSLQKEGKLSSNNRPSIERFGKKPNTENEYDSVSNNDAHDVINNFPSVHEEKKPFSFQEEGQISSDGNSIESSGKKIKLESASNFVPNNESNNHFAFPNGVINNISAVHEGNKPCKKEFDRKNYVKRHVNSVHEGIKNQCNICNKAFTENSSLRRHVESVHEGLVFSCTFCGVSYATKCRLKTHIS